jgi:alkylated DNA repair dioxygenase AlkB
MSATQTELFGMPSSNFLPEGFQYKEDVLNCEDDARLVKELAALPLKEFKFRGFEGKRRVISFGWHYSFNDHKLSRAEPIPAFLLDIYNKARTAAGFGLANIDQALVTEYAPGAGIGWHKDRPVFKQVMGISLASPCVLRLRKRVAHKWQRVSVNATPGSAYFFEGPARWEWEHSIPAVEKLRYSITFRNLD